MRREGTKWRALIGPGHHVECEHVDPDPCVAVEWGSGGRTDRTSKERGGRRQGGRSPTPTTNRPVWLSFLGSRVYARVDEDRRGRSRDERGPTVATRMDDPRRVLSCG